MSDIKKEEISVKIYKVNNSIEEKDNISWYYMLISGLSLLFMLLIFQLFYSQKITNFMFGKEPKNILIYIINILIFISVCVFISMVAKNIIDFKQKTIKESHILKKGLYISAISLTMCSIFIMFISMYINASKVRYSESGHFIWREWKQTILLIFTVVLTISFILLFENYKKLSLPKIASILLALFCFAYTFYCMCYGNYIPSTPYLLHTNAIFESVYNYYYDIPKSDINFSIYGHYGLLLNFIFKIIGLSGKKFVFVMAFITAICVLCIVLTIFNITKNLFVRIAASLSALYLFSFMYVPTYQIIIRIVFPAVMLAYLSFIVRYKFVKRKWSVAGSYFLAALAFTWNTETGLVILISIVFFYCYIAFCEYNLKQLKFYICVLKQILYFVLSISAVFLFVNIYNFIIGGHFISIEVFSPSLMSGDYIKSLVLPLFNDLGPNVPWVYNFSLILIVLGLGIAHCLASSKKINNASHYAFITTVSIMTIGCFTYYINRPAYGNLYDTYLVSILLIVILADHCLNNIIVFNKRTVSSILQRCCLYTSILVLFFGSILVGINTVDFNKNRQFYKQDKSLLQLEDFIYNNIPKDTVALGMGVSSIYADLGWDTGVHITDFASIALSEKAEDIVLNIFKKAKEPLFINSNLASCSKKFGHELSLIIQENYDVVHIYKYGDGTSDFLYLVPKSE